jgi:hypothetical protein
MTADSVHLLNAREVTLMARVTRQSWTPEQINLLISMIEKDASAARASVVLRRSKIAVQTKARQLGRPFADVREVKAARLAREAGELEANGRSDVRRQAQMTMER